MRGSDCSILRSWVVGWLSAVLLASTHSVTAQDSDVIQDFGVWAGAEYETEIFKDFELGVEQQFRFEDNAQHLDHIHTNIGLGYKVTDLVRIAGNYRLSLNRRDNDLFARSHRATADLILRHSIKQWRFTYRGRMQWDFRGHGYTMETGNTPSSKFRNKFQVQYQIDRKTAVYGDFNIRVLVFDPRDPGFSGINRFRYRAGVKFLTTEYSGVDLFFQHDRDVNVAKPDHLYIVGVGFGFENWKPLFRR